MTDDKLRERFEAEKSLPWCDHCDMRASGKWRWCVNYQCAALRSRSGERK